MPVLGTKLRIPAPRRQLVARDRLLRHLQGDDGSTPRLVLVSAPAGFGKTTLLTQWLTADPPSRHVAWLSLDAGDSDPRRFVTHLVAALQHTGAHVGDEALALLAADRGLPGEDVVASLVNDLDIAESPVVVALDDYHVIADPGVHDILGSMLEHLPSHVMVAMTTRADPPLPLARMRARGELLELRASDLRFTPDEAGAFLNHVMNLGLTPDLVSALETKTEGWAAGLQMAALSARGRSRSDTSPGAVEAFVDDFTGSHRYVLDYLLEEVLAGQPSDVRAFLLDTSVLEQLTATLCDALTHHTDGQRLLEALERDNVFVICLDDQRQWFRYHHLFADALRARLLDEEPERVPELHRRASLWYAEHGALADAITHALCGIL